MSVIKTWTLAVFLLLVTGCASQLVQSTDVTLAPGVSLRLADPPTTLIADNWQQVLTVTHQNQQHTLLAQLDIKADNGIKLVVMSAQGLPLFTLQKLPNKPITSTKMIPLALIEPRFILADIMLVHWPIISLNTQLVGAKMIEQNNQRALLKHSDELVTITKSDKQTTLVNHQRDYKILFQKVN